MSTSGGVVLAAPKPQANELSKLLHHHDESLDQDTQRSVHLRRLGFVALSVVICSNIVQAETVQWLQTAIEFKKPFFIMCLSHAAPAVILPLMYVYFRVYGDPENRHAGFNVVDVMQRHSVIPFSKLLRLATFFGAFYLISDYFWFAAFKNLTVAAGAVILNSIPIFVYCLSICVLHEKASIKKLCGVLTAFVGVVLVVMFQDGSDPKGLADSSVVAGLMMLVAAATSAIFEVALSQSAGDDMNDIATLLMFSGLCGVVAAPLWLVGTVIFACSPFPTLYEPIGLPETPEGMFMLSVAVLMFVINFVCLTISICWTSPLETSVGFMLAIPVSALVDLVVHHTSFSWECIVGSVLVMTGFCVLEFSSLKLTSHRGRRTCSR